MDVEPATWLLSGPDWSLFRAPLRPEGDTGAPSFDAATRVGTVAVPGHVQAHAGFDDLWTDVQNSPGSTTTSGCT